MKSTRAILAFIAWVIITICIVLLGESCSRRAWAIGGFGARSFSAPRIAPRMPTVSRSVALPSVAPRIASKPFTPPGYHAPETPLILRPAFMLLWLWLSSHPTPSPSRKPVEIPAVSK